MSRYRYEIDEANTVRIWDDEVPNENGAPFLLQPNYPNNEPWGTREAAEAWTLLYINELEDPNSEFVAGPSPAEPSLLRVPPVE